MTARRMYQRSFREKGVSTVDQHAEKTDVPVSGDTDVTPDGVIWYQDESLFDVEGLDDETDNESDEALEFWATDIAPFPEADDSAPSGPIVVSANGVADAGERFRTHWSSRREAAPVSGQSASAVWATVSEPETVSVPAAIRLPAQRVGTEPADPATPPVTDFIALAAAVAGIQFRHPGAVEAVEVTGDLHRVADTSHLPLPGEPVRERHESPGYGPIEVANTAGPAERTVIETRPLLPSLSWKDKWGPSAVNPPFPGAEPLHRPSTAMSTPPAMSVGPRTDTPTEQRQQVNPLTIRRLLLTTLVAAAVVLLIIVSTKLFGGSTKSPQLTIPAIAVTAPVSTTPATPSSQPLTTQPSTALVEFG